MTATVSRHGETGAGSVGWFGVAAVVLPASSAGAVAGYGDVPEGQWFTDPVQWSADGDVTGLDGACFEPDRMASRGEMAVWLWNMEGQPHAAAPHSFTDVTDPGQQDPVSWLLAEGITTGTTDTTFSPTDGLTRGQFAAFLWRLAGQPSAAAHSFTDVAATWQQGPVVVATRRGDHDGHDRDDVLTRQRTDTGPARDVPVPLQR